MADMQKVEILDRVLETGKLRDEVKDDDGTAKHLPPVDHPPDVRREIFRFACFAIGSNLSWFLVCKWKWPSGLRRQS